MPKGAASECGGMGRTRERNPSRQAKAAKTGVLRRYIFYEMQADQGVKAIQFVKLRVLVVITNICNSNTIGKACAAPPRRRTIAFGSPPVGKARVGAPLPNLQLRGGFRGHLRAAPARRVGAVAPAARAIERVHADPVELVHGARPPRMHPIGVVMRRLADLRQPQPAVERRGGDALGALHRVGLVERLRPAVAREGELTGEMAVRVLIDDAAD